MPLHADFCVRLQNAARARIRSVPVHATNANLGMASILLQHGFIHNVTRGTASGPSPEDYRRSGVARRRLWIDLKYKSDQLPVLGGMSAISVPSRKMRLDNGELLRIATGRRVKSISPLRLGEIAIVDCGPDGWWEVRDAIKNGLEGELVARVG